MFCFCFLQLKDAEKHEIFNLDIALIFLSLEFIGRIDFSRFFEPPRQWKLVFEKSGVHFILIYAKEEKKFAFNVWSSPEVCKIEVPVCFENTCTGKPTVLDCESQLTMVATIFIALYILSTCPSILSCNALSWELPEGFSESHLTKFCINFWKPFDNLLMAFVSDSQSKCKKTTRRRRIVNLWQLTSVPPVRLFQPSESFQKDVKKMSKS